MPAGHLCSAGGDAPGPPLPLRGIDSDNGGEFINDQLWRYCRAHDIQFTRGRPYKKDDNAPIEQKHWTHVRKLLGWERYATPEARDAVNGLYRDELRLMMNLFQPAVNRSAASASARASGACMTRRRPRSTARWQMGGAERVAPYVAEDQALVALRLVILDDQGSAVHSEGIDQQRLTALHTLRQHLDPFALAEAIDRKLTQIHRLALSGPSQIPLVRPAPKPFRIRSVWAKQEEPMPRVSGNRINERDDRRFGNTYFWRDRSPSETGPGVPRAAARMASSSSSEIRRSNRRNPERWKPCLRISAWISSTRSRSTSGPSV